MSLKHIASFLKRKKKRWFFRDIFPSFFFGGRTLERQKSSRTREKDVGAAESEKKEQQRDKVYLEA
jgi:hypothetical protein